jgi:hypothetical protein
MLPLASIATSAGLLRPLLMIKAIEIPADVHCVIVLFP